MSTVLLIVVLISSVAYILVLTSYSHYTLPAPRRYDVTLKKKSKSLRTEVMVNEKDVTLTSLDQIPSWIEGNLTIVWNQRMKAEKVQTGKRIILFVVRYWYENKSI